VSSRDIKFKSSPGELAVAASTTITFASPLNGTPKVVEYKDGMLHRTVIEMAPMSWATTSAALCVGQKLYTFPLGWILPVAAKIKFNITYGAATSSTAGEVALGTTIGTGAAAVTSGTAGFENWLTGQTMANQVASTALPQKFAGAAGGVSGTMDALDGSSTAKALYWNHSTTNVGTGGASLTQGTVTIWWINLGDYNS
jgi:hypothetical protein